MSFAKNSILRSVIYGQAENLNLSVTEQDARRIEVAFTKHLIGFTSYKEYYSDLVRLKFRVLAKPLRACAFRDSNLSFNFKLAVLQCIQKDKCLNKYFTMYGSEINIYVVRQIKKDERYDKWRQIVIDAPLWQESYNETRKHCATIITALRVYVTKFVIVKLRFLVSSNSLEINDIVNDLMLKATETYYNVMPYLSELHTINTIKRAVHNEGINIINYYTAEKRSRLVLNPDVIEVNTGLTNRIVSYDITDKNNASEGQELSEIVTVDDPAFNQYELRDAYEKILSTVDDTSKRALNLFHLIDDPEFTRMVKKHEPNIGKKDCEAIFRKIGPAKYRKFVRLYVGMTKKEMKNLINYTRKSLGGYENAAWR